MRLLVAALLVIAGVLSSGCTSTPNEVPPQPTGPSVSQSAPAAPCKLFPLRGVNFSGCADAVIRVTSVADQHDALPKFEISNDGKDYVPYDPNTYKAPIGLVATFGVTEECSGCGAIWRIDVRIDSRLSTVLGICRGGTIDSNGCIDQGSPAHLGSPFRIMLRHNGHWEFLYIYFNKVA